MLALRLLAQHRIGDQEWIAAWLAFKREHHERRLADIAETLRMLEEMKGGGQADTNVAAG